ncbi:MAG: RnfABCDGE type electron transport complex subunit D [Synergistaceae bacterium]|nr:RnfABCDGE type electron transport complex subunit D [Synergistaceae bacterium]
MTERLLVVSSSPHIHSPLDTQKIMMWVLIALAPAGLAGVYFFGLRAALVMAVCVAACVASEYIWQKLAKRKPTCCDLSAAVTGLLIAYNLPPTIPFWEAAVGCVFAIIVVKQCFGGIGANIVNPALAGRALMLSSWPVAMTSWTVDGVSTATPLALIKAGAVDKLPSIADAFIGHIGGCIGETSSVALLIGFGILLAKDIIKWHIPVVYVAAATAFSCVFALPCTAFYEIFAGGLLLGSIFMATDYTTSPMTVRGQVIFAFGCGLLTALIRAYGGYPEGVSYSILIMNITVPLIDKFTTPHIFGEVKKHG